MSADGFLYLSYHLYQPLPCLSFRFWSRVFFFRPHFIKVYKYITGDSTFNKFWQVCFKSGIAQNTSLVPTRNGWWYALARVSLKMKTCLFNRTLKIKGFVAELKGLRLSLLLEKWPKGSTTLPLRKSAPSWVWDGVSNFFREISTKVRYGTVL